MAIHLIALFGFDGVQLLDVTGPASVFGLANTLDRREAYKIVVVSPRGGLVESSCGVVLQTVALAKLKPSKVHTLLVAGGEAATMKRAAAHPDTQKWLPKCERTAQRIGSICSGAFVLASLGMLGKARVAAHWASCAALAEFPEVSVDAESLFVVSGNGGKGESQDGDEHQDRPPRSLGGAPADDC